MPCNPLLASEVLTSFCSKLFVALVTEFMIVWALCGEASLNLTSTAHPGAPQSLPPSPTPLPSTHPPSQQPQHGGPAEQEHNPPVTRQQEQLHQHPLPDAFLVLQRTVAPFSLLNLKVLL